MKKLYIYLVVLAVLSLSMPATAQVLPFVASDHSSSSMAKGGTSLTDISNTAYSAFQSPAAMVFSQGVMDLSAGYMLYQPAQVRTNIINAAGMYKVNDKFGIAAGVSYGMFPKYDIFDGSGKASGVFRPSELELSTGLAWRLHENISVGANVGYAVSRLSEAASYSALVADIQALAVFGGFKASVALSDIGTGVTSASGVKFSLPASLGLAAGYDADLLEEHAVGLDAQAQYYLSGDLAASLGARYTYADMVSVSAGYRYGGSSVIPSFVSVGAGVKIAGIKLDLAYLISSTAVDDTMCLSLGYSF